MVNVKRVVHCYFHFIVSDVSGFLIRRQNRPDILSAGEEVNSGKKTQFFFDVSIFSPKSRLLGYGFSLEKQSIFVQNVINTVKVERIELQFLFNTKFCIFKHLFSNRRRKSDSNTCF